jgi:two-component system, NarL family, response regulator NreC
MSNASAKSPETFSSGLLMGKKKRILIAEDHTILRDGLRMLISLTPEFETVGEARDGLEAIHFSASLRPDLVLMDLSMPRMNGTEAIQVIKKQCPWIKILVLTAYKTDNYILASLKAGADGYVLKDLTYSELNRAIHDIFSGKSYFSPEISEGVTEEYLERGKGLTLRERQILKLIAEGCRNKNVANYLSISTNTVRKHRANLMNKLNLHSASSLKKFAMESDLITK